MLQPTASIKRIAFAACTVLAAPAAFGQAFDAVRLLGAAPGTDLGIVGAAVVAGTEYTTLGSGLVFCPQALHARLLGGPPQDAPKSARAAQLYEALAADAPGVSLWQGGLTVQIFLSTLARDNGLSVSRVSWLIAAAEKEPGETALEAKGSR